MKSAIFMLNRECNQNCRFCLNNFEKNKDMDLNEKKDVIDMLKENGVEVIAFSGGEPLLCKDLAEIVEYAHMKGLKVLLQTNAILLTESIMKRLQGKIMVVEVSLEGLEKEHNFLTRSANFKKAIKNISMAAKYAQIFTNFTITRHNMDCVEGYVKMLEGLGIRAANFTKLYLSGNALKNLELKPTENEYERFLERLANIKTSMVLNVQAGFDERILKKYKIKSYSLCSLGKEITITPDGGLRLCPAWPKSLGKAIGFRLNAIKEIKGEKCCAVNTMMEGKCIGLEMA